MVALCDTRPELAARRAKEWGIAPRVYSDFAQVLDDRAIDAVELLTPTWLHADQVVQALAAGKHVSCQKPLATTVAEAGRIADAVSRAKTTFPPIRPSAPTSCRVSASAYGIVPSVSRWNSLQHVGVGVDPATRANASSAAVPGTGVRTTTTTARTP